MLQDRHLTESEWIVRRKLHSHVAGAVVDALGSAIAEVPRNDRQARERVRLDAVSAEIAADPELNP